MNTTMPLYASLVPETTYDFVCKQTFTRQQITLSLRPVSLPGDWPHIAKWLFRELMSTGSHLPGKYLQETFSTMLQCDFAQPFIGILHDHPAFLVEICAGDRHCDALEEGAHTFESGDHIMRLVLSPTVINTPHWSEWALFISLEYFFSHRQIKRIVWELHEKDKHYMNLAHTLGFKNNNAHDWPGIHVFLYSREKFTRFSGAYHQQIQKLA